ncbi:MAG: DUF2807 domain-containing protein [Prevotella sp.]|nr:DUF2807 domain-containing protein [Prevotella sp.]
MAIAGGFDVFYEQADTSTIRVVGSADALKDIDIRLDGNTLVIGMKENSNFFNMSKDFEDVEIYITSVDLIDVSIAGSGDFKAPNKVDTDRMSLSVAGSGDIEFNDIICDALKAEIAGSGEIDVRNIVTGDTKLAIAGSGDMDFHFTKGGNVQVEIAGSGDVKLSGKVSSTNYDIAGSGEIDDKNLVKE